MLLPVIRSTLAAVLAAGAASLALPPAPSAAAGEPRLVVRAAAGGKLQVRLQGARRGPMRFAVTGGSAVRSRRSRAILDLGPRRAGRPSPWRSVSVRRRATGRLVARSRVAAAFTRARRGPTLVVQRLARTRRSGHPRVRIHAAGASPRCRIDDRRAHPCARKLTLRATDANRHTLAVTASNRRGRARVVVPWKRETPPSTGAPSPQAPSPPAPAPPAQPGGDPDRLIFADDFSGSTLDREAWRPYTSAGHAGHGLRRPSAITLDGEGHLVITAAMENGVLVSGGMSHHAGFRYGRVEFRVRTEPDPAGVMNGVVLTWPDSGRWPVDGEIDIYETGNATGTRSPFKSFVHYDETNRQRYFIHEADGTQWHDIALDWRADRLLIYRDGRLVWNLTDTVAIPDVSHHLCIQLDAMVEGALERPVRLLVDHVRIYR